MLNILLVGYNKTKNNYHKIIIHIYHYQHIVFTELCKALDEISQTSSLLFVDVTNLWKLGGLSSQL